MSILRQGSPVDITYYTPPDTTIVIDATTASSRKNSDGNYYTITFPEDFVGTRGTSDDPFKDVRIGTSPIIMSGPPYPKLNVIINVPEDMKVGANTTTSWLYADPSFHFRLDTDEFDASILSRLNITVNNYGTIIGAGGIGGYGGMVVTGSKTLTYFVSDGGGSGFGLHPSWGTTSIDDFRDPANETDASLITSGTIAGQAGSGYGWWLTGAARPNAFGANGQHGTLEGHGMPGASAHGNAGKGSHLPAGGGGTGGSVFYITSNVHGTVHGTSFNVYNKGWISAGTGGGGGSQSYVAAKGAGNGGSWSTQWVDHAYGNPYELGQGGDGQNITGAGGIYALGGLAGNFIWEASANLVVANSINNQSANTIYGRDGIWQGI
jgi:hypothetical protein